MKTSAFVLLGAGAVVLTLAAVPSTARADHDEALAFVAGAVVGHVIAGHDHRYHPVPRRYRHAPAVRHFRSHPGMGHYQFHRRVEHPHWKHHNKRDHGRYERRHHRDHDHHRGRGRH